jgi:uncharacterized Fe-S radical SAM superfamily protein PflX
MIVPSFSPDTSLVLDKAAAVNQANFNLRAVNLRERFKAALSREERLQELWRETSEQLAARESQLKLKEQELIELGKQLDIRIEEAEAIDKFCRKARRKNLIIGILVGSAVTGTVMAVTGR